MYSIGVDSGTLSEQAVLVESRDKTETAPSVFDDPHNISNRTFVEGRTPYATQPQANHIDAIAAKHEVSCPQRYLGKDVSDWHFRKLLQIPQASPERYHPIEQFVEMSNSVIWQLTDNETRNICTASYKMRVPSAGCPTNGVDVMKRLKTMRDTTERE